MNRKSITPGEILSEDYMKPLGLTQNALARVLHVPPRRINEIVHGKRAVTLDTSLRLGRYLGQSPRFWLNLQNECDLRSQ
jgi:addiction module HigA family antidote